MAAAVKAGLLLGAVLFVGGGLAARFVAPRLVAESAAFRRRVVAGTLLGFGLLAVLSAFDLAVTIHNAIGRIDLGLLGQSRRLDQLLLRVSLERGLVLGGLLLAAGAACFVVALTSWGAGGFGPLDVVSSMRLPIVGSMLAVTGFSIVTVSFTLSLTRIGER